MASEPPSLPGGRGQATPGAGQAIATGAAGATGGTFIVALANLLSDKNDLKDPLRIAAPIIAVVIAGVVNYIATMWRRRGGTKDYMMLRASLLEKIANDTTPEELKETYRRTLAEL